MNSVDVIVPCYNYGRYLARCVNSVLDQSGPAVRVLIIDDTSSDDSAVIGQRLAAVDSRVTLIHHPVNRGHIATYNEGLAWATADYVLLLSADDYLLPGALRRAANLMDAHPEVSFTFGNVLTQRDEEGITREYFELDAQPTRILSGEEFCYLSGSRNIVRTPTVVVRTALHQRVGGYRADLPHSGDMELWFRLAAHGSVGLFNEYQAVYRLHSTSMSVGYMDSYRLSDLQQRKAAIDYFLAHDGRALPHPHAVARALARELALDALGCASDALRDGQAETARKVQAYAASVFPPIRFSVVWAKLAVRRRLGRRVSASLARVLRPGRSRLQTT